VTGVTGWQLTALIASIACVAIAMALLPIARRSELAASRLLTLRRRGSGQPDQNDEPTSAPLRVLSWIGRLVLGSGLLSRSAINDLEQTLSATSNRAGARLALFVGVKFVMLFALPLAGWSIIRLAAWHIPVLFPMMVLAVAGLLLPDMAVRRYRKKYLRSVDLGMPAALDLLIMCAEAGLSLEAGLERVAVDAKSASPATANEFRITANEMKILADRRQALINIGVRTKLDSAMRLGSALAQSLKYGTPLTQALRVLAAEMRQAELTRFEERAARIPVLLTVPMIVFILPCIFVVVGGPAAVRVVQTFMHK
jgi:tight adherence protein C